MPISWVTKLHAPRIISRVSSNLIKSFKIRPHLGFTAFKHRTKLIRTHAEHPPDKPGDLLAHSLAELLALRLESSNLIPNKSIGGDRISTATTDIRPCKLNGPRSFNVRF